jgi:transposase
MCDRTDWSVYMASDDPEFEAKAANIIGLYLNPPQHAAFFCVDERSAIQALDRLDPVLPLSPVRLKRHGFEYFRHGTLSLYGALNVATGQVQRKTAARHASTEFVDFPDQLWTPAVRKRSSTSLLDNLSAHKTKQVGELLEAHRNVRLHFTPTYSSQLNQVGIWIAKIERDVIARGVFTSVRDLARKIMRYIRAYAKTAKPFRWKYSNVRKRIKPC